MLFLPYCKDKGEYSEISFMETLETIEFLGNPLTEWLIALAYIVGSVIIARILSRIFSNRVRKWTEGTETEIDDVIVDAVEEPISIAVVLLGFWLGYSHLNFEASGTNEDGQRTSVYITPQTYFPQGV